jgi:8-oxo-dGTP pyrophosphatase MutT (NUDIX family)
MRGEKVFVVMVEQFRIALRAVTLEAAGGEADEDDPRVSMARELEEEINLHVRSDRIKLVYTAFIQPPILTSKVFGGIVRISESDLPKELLGGEHQFGEFTVLTVRSLIPLLKSRDAGEFTFDLETSRLLDAVAEAVGLIERRY